MARTTTTPHPPITPAEREALSRVIAIDAPKGGVGKTSIACALAVLLAGMGHSVLLVSADSQDDPGAELGYRTRGLADRGEAFAEALQTGEAMQPSVRDVRKGLDVVCGGELLTRRLKFFTGQDALGDLDPYALARVLAPTAAVYDFVIIDNAPGEDTLRTLVLNTCKWVLVPVGSDEASENSVQALADRFEQIHQTNPGLTLLGVALFRMSSGATKVRRETVRTMKHVVGDSAPVFDNIIRTSEGAAKDVRKYGMVPHELALKRQEPGWSRLNATVEQLADDYVGLANEIVARIADYERKN